MKNIRVFQPIKNINSMQRGRQTHNSRVTVKDVQANSTMMNEHEDIYTIYDNLKQEVASLIEMILDAPNSNEMPKM